MGNVDVHNEVGKLTLADAMIGEVVADLRLILAHANWPGTIRGYESGQTTQRMASKLERELAEEPALASKDLMTWIEDVVSVASDRDRIVHAVALDQCLSCGQASMFRHPRSEERVDRSPEAVAAIRARYEDLRGRAIPLATALADAVNDRILRHAKRIANDQDQIQNPPQASPRLAEHVCAACSGKPGRTRVAVGTAREVIPDGRWEEYIGGRWPPMDEAQSRPRQPGRGS